MWQTLNLRKTVQVNFMSKSEWELFKEAADKPANNPRPDLRTLSFTIRETWCDMWILGRHYIRPDDDAEWVECFDCQGWGCFSGDRYGKS